MAEPWAYARMMLHVIRNKRWNCAAKGKSIIIFRYWNSVELILLAYFWSLTSTCASMECQRGSVCWNYNFVAYAFNWITVIHAKWFFPPSSTVQFILSAKESNPIFFVIGFGGVNHFINSLGSAPILPDARVPESHSNWLISESCSFLPTYRSIRHQKMSNKILKNGQMQTVRETRVKNCPSVKTDIETLLDHVSKIGWIRCSLDSKSRPVRPNGLTPLCS